MSMSVTFAPSASLSLSGMTSDDYLRELQAVICLVQDKRSVDPSLLNPLQRTQAICATLQDTIAIHLDDLAGLPLDETECADIVSLITDIGTQLSHIQADLLGCEDNGGAAVYERHVARLSILRSYFQSQHAAQAPVLHRSPR
jgi:hypothetical protein